MRHHIIDGKTMRPTQEQYWIHFQNQAPLSWGFPHIQHDHNRPESLAQRKKNVAFVEKSAAGYTIRRSRAKRANAGAERATRSGTSSGSTLSTEST